MLEPQGHTLCCCELGQPVLVETFLPKDRQTYHQNCVTSFHTLKDVTRGLTVNHTASPISKMIQ